MAHPTYLCAGGQDHGGCTRRTRTAKGGDKGDSAPPPYPSSLLSFLACIAARIGEEVGDQDRDLLQTARRYASACRGKALHEKDEHGYRESAARKHG